MNIRTLSNRIMDLTLAGLLSFSLVYALTTSLIFETLPEFIVFRIVALLVLYSFIFLDRFSLRTSLLLLAGFFSSLLVFLAGSGFITKSNQYFLWLGSYIQGVINVNSAFESFTVSFLCIFVTLIIYLLTIKTSRYLIVMLAGILLFAGQWILEFFVSYSAFYVFVFALIIYYFKYIYSRNSLREPNNYVSQAALVFWAIPICLLVIFVSLKLPVRNKPIKWEWLDDRLIDLFNRFNSSDYTYQTFDYFSFSEASFGTDDTKLGGKLNQDHTLVLRVKSPKVMYLRGSVNDIYTGSSWEKSRTTLNQAMNSVDMLSLDVNEMLKGFSLLSPERDFKSKYMTKDDVTITFQYIKTKSLFTPIKTIEVNPFDAPDLRVTSDQFGVLTTDEANNKGFRYGIDVYNIRRHDKDFQKAMTGSFRGLYSDIIRQIDNAIMEKSGQYGDVQNIRLDTPAQKALDEEAERIITRSENGKTVTKQADPIQILYSIDELRVLKRDLETFAEHSNNVYSKYLQLPANLPERIRELSLSITEEYDNNFDKVTAIENYFVRNDFKYTLSPADTPADQDFVDYFLFNLKEGYCTYYASAMTVMLRSIGIPARYVEGYVMPLYPEYADIYDVTNNKAHAWVEVYFEGIGWLNFEPTPTFNTNLYYDGKSVSYSGPNYSMEDFMPKNPGNTGLIDGNNDNQNKITRIKLIITIVLFALLAAVILIIVINASRRKMKLSRMLKMDPRKGVLYLYKYFLKLLNLQGLGIRPGETPTDYCERISANINYKYVSSRTASFRTVTDIFLKARYSTDEITAKDRDIVYSYTDRLLLKTKYSLGRVKYYLYQFILGRI